MARRQRRQSKSYTKADNINVKQSATVQGAQRMGKPPLEANVQLRADLAEKYLGSGLVGFGPALHVLQNRDGDPLLMQQGYGLYRKMLTDSEVDASLDVLIQAASSQPLAAISPLTPTDDNYALSKELADFVNYVFSKFDMDSWRREQLRQALAFGNSVSEIDWDIVEDGPWKDHFIVTRLRLQQPENYGFIVDRWGEVYGVAPLGAAAGTQFPIGNLIALSSNPFATKILEGAVPRYKLAVWTWEQRGTDPRGTSALLAAYIPWWSKQRALEEWSCWLGRYAQPSIWATPGPDALPVCVTLADGTQIITQPTEKLLEALKNFKSASVLALPYGSELHIAEVTGGAEPFLKSIEAFDAQITKGILGQHQAVAAGADGKSMEQIRGIILRMVVGGIRRWVAQNIQRDIVKPLIEANYGNVEGLLPVIDLGDGDGFPITATEVAVLFQAGYFSEDQLPYIDKQLGIPVRQSTNRVGPVNDQNVSDSKPAEEDKSRGE